MKTERELFEEYLLRTDKFKFRNKTFLFMLDDSGEYEDQPVLEHWESWQASAKREGFILVPVEPTDEMLNAGCKSITYSMTNIENSNRIYKAMIEAANDV